MTAELPSAPVASVNEESTMPRQIREPDREIAAAILIGACGRFLLQQRDDIPGILYPGQISLFGGHREGDETFLACLQRELEEEIGLSIEAERCEPLVRFASRSPSGTGVTAEFFVVRDIPLEGIVVTEGAPMIVPADALRALLPRMTPTSCYALRLFLELERSPGA